MRTRALFVSVIVGVLVLAVPSLAAARPDAGTGAIRGSVTRSATGGALDHLDVLLFRNGNFKADTYTATDGSYTFDGLAAATYAVCVDPGPAEHDPSPDGLVPTCYRDAPWNLIDVPAHAKPVVVRDGKVTKGVDVALGDGGEITGSVRSARHGPAPTGTVFVLKPSGDPYDVAAQVSIDRGRYVLTGVPPSESGYDVCFDQADNGYLSECYDRQFWTGYGSLPPAGTTRVPVTADTLTTGIDDGATHGGRITGRVTGGGAPQPDVIVYAFGSNGEFAATAETGNDGRYELSSLVPSDAGYVVCFEGYDANAGSSRNGYVPQCYQDKPWNGLGKPPDHAAHVVVRDQRTTGGIDATLDPAGAIAGVVSGPDGSGLEGAIVTVLDSHENYVEGRSTSASGTYRATRLRAGNHYTVCFSDTGYADQCFKGQAWDGSLGDIPAGTKPVSVVLGAVTKNIDAVLTPSS